MTISHHAPLSLAVGGAWHIVLPWVTPPLMANGTARGNRRAHAALRAEVRQDVRTLLMGLRRQGPPAPLERVLVLLTWYPGRNGSMADPDNINPTLKPCLDALVDERWLENDTGRHVALAACSVVPLSADPWVDRVGRLVLSVWEAGAVRLPTLAPGKPGALTTIAPDPR